MDLNIHTDDDVKPRAAQPRPTERTEPSVAGAGQPPATERTDPSVAGAGQPPAPVGGGGGGGGAGGAKPSSSDDLYGKILKYIPAPLIGVYLFAQNLVFSSDDPSEGLSWGIFVFFAILVGLYLYFRQVRRAIQIGLSVLAFAAWATASPGPFQLMDDWDPMYASLSLAAIAAILITVPLPPLPQEE